MSQELERVYTINLGKVLLSPDNQRSKRAINMIREFARHHMKTEEIKIEEDLSKKIWSRGIRSPPRKIRVRMTKTEDGFILVAPYEESEPVSDKKKEKLEEKISEQTETSEVKEVADIAEEAKPKKEEAKPKKEEAKPKKEEAKPKKEEAKPKKEEAKPKKSSK
jgi:large subunit ribosomal protein L31e